MTNFSQVLGLVRNGSASMGSTAGRLVNEMIRDKDDDDNIDDVVEDSNGVRLSEMCLLGGKANGLGDMGWLKE